MGWTPVKTLGTIFCSILVGSIFTVIFLSGAVSREEYTITDHEPDKYFIGKPGSLEIGSFVPDPVKD